MKLEILSGVIIYAEPVEAGSFVEADKALADLLIGSNKAILVPEEVQAEGPKKGRKSTPQTPEEATP